MRERRCFDGWMRAWRLPMNEQIGRQVESFARVSTSNWRYSTRKATITSLKIKLH